jgi:hypothetical protein
MLANAPRRYFDVAGDDGIPGDVAAHVPLVDPQFPSEAPLREPRPVDHLL